MRVPRPTLLAPKCVQIIRRAFSVQKVGVLGVPFEEGQHRNGVGNAPAYLRNHGLIQHLKTIDNIDVVDYGDVKYSPEAGIKPVPNMKNLEHVAACSQETSKMVQKILADGRLALSIGGDHATAIGTVDGHVQAKGANNVALIWIDAHGDLNTNCTSESGNVHGMPVALLIKELSDYWPYLPGMDWQKPLLSVRDVAYIGLRSIDKYERLIIEKFGVNAFGMEDIQRLGIISVIQMVLSRVDPFHRKSIHLSMDIDALDVVEAPCTGTPVRGGLTLREAICIMEAMYRTGRLNALDIVEINPKLGDSKDLKTTMEAAMCLIMAGCGYMRQGPLYPNAELPTNCEPETKD